MHDALRIDEILTAIFADLILDPVMTKCTPRGISNDGDNYWYSKPTLLALAFTCKTFYEPATRVLWRQVNDIDRLLRVMPHHVVKVLNPRWTEKTAEETWRDGQDVCLRWLVGNTKAQSYIVFVQCPSEADWKTFERFASYIRRVGKTDSQRARLKLGSNVLPTLAAHFASRGIPIFPQLRELCCMSCEDFQCTPLLLSPRLNTLQISSRSPDTCLTCLAAYTSSAIGNITRLEHIHLTLTRPSYGAYAYFSDILVACTNPKLRTLNASGVFVDSSVAKAIFRSPILEKLTIGLSSYNADEMLDGISRPCLKQLDIEFDAAKAGDNEILWKCFYSDWVERLYAPSLVDIRIKGGAYHPAFTSDVWRFLEMLSAPECFADTAQAWRKPGITLSPDTTSLRTLDPSIPLPSEYVCTFSNSLHLLCKPSAIDPTRSRFAELQTLNFQKIHVDLTDEELGTLGRALPRLTTLMFSSDGHGRGKSRTTLVGLWLLARHCKHVETFSLFIDASFDWRVFTALAGNRALEGPKGGNKGPIVDWAQIQNPNLFALYVGDSTIQEEDFVSDFLSAVFPCIVNLCYTQSREMSEDMEKWRAVRHQLM